MLDTVPGFDSLFPLYRAEYQSDSLIGHSPVWNKEILSARTYGEFCDYQFRDLVRLRFIPRDLPESWRAAWILPVPGCWKPCREKISRMMLTGLTGV